MTDVLDLIHGCFAFCYLYFGLLCYLYLMVNPTSYMHKPWHWRFSCFFLCVLGWPLVLEHLDK
jgi:hypothetical protein